MGFEDFMEANWEAMLCVYIVLLRLQSVRF